MDRIEVPHFEASAATTVGEALYRLGAKGRAALVETGPDGDRLLFFGDLMHAQRDGITLLKDVPIQAPLARLAIVDGADDFLAQESSRAFFAGDDGTGADNSADYVVSSVKGDSVEIFTRFETLVTMIASTGGFRCTGTPTHYFPAPGVRIGETCPLAPECANADGGTPTIRAL